ncbi:hypothetical protein [Sinorhizobium saheli]|uniref:Uncharacterized protein n=1 Tax=Sinorhizobium saheli TaxID=36856 RepID=A0A178YR34_SINSA|nr:hypothetical protein [Sinorhizobium saheli]MQW90683.1 hypothetical protein [Sinorhizobium saheli]OAP50062.1 hypothetical protein ATB98_12185 [Sinorhizobium saheli]
MQILIERTGLLEAIANILSANLRQFDGIGITFDDWADLADLRSELARDVKGNCHRARDGQS